MKNVLCFGDSNTYGYDPAGMRDGTAVRYAQDVRWCGVAQRDLGEGWHVIEEGLNGRTTVRDDMCHLDTNLNGIRALPMLLEAHKPLDAIVIMLGTNDCKTVFSVGAADIARRRHGADSHRPRVSLDRSRALPAYSADGAYQD
ncbi:MAG: GDSL-type esterase/lipase family protein [Collinsella sp.]